MIIIIVPNDFSNSTFFNSKMQSSLYFLGKHSEFYVNIRDENHSRHIQQPSN